MKHLVFLLEERSAEELLRSLAPRVIPPEVETHYLVFEGKQDLEKQLVRRLRGWLRPETRFVVLRDQDAGDCRTVKRRLVDLCSEGRHPEAVVRIACRELESWYLGDLAAVEKGLGLPGLARHQAKAKFRSPDSLSSPSQELQALTGGQYQKVAGSRAIGAHLDLTANCSPSFQAFLGGLRRCLGARD